MQFNPGWQEKWDVGPLEDLGKGRIQNEEMAKDCCPGQFECIGPP